MSAILLLAMLGAAGPGDDALREPYLAVRTGLKCSACHTNVTGGGNRSAFGNIFAQTQLPLTPASAVVRKQVAEFLRVGFDLRGEGVAIVEGDPEAANLPRTAANLDVAQVYLAAAFLEERLQVYVDQTVGPERAVAREAFALVRRLPLEGYAKAGKFLLPFGLRIQDDDELIRLPVTGVGYATPEQGLEVGIEPGPLALSVAVTNGSVLETNSSKRVTSRAALVFPRFRVGASASLDERPGAERRELAGAFGGLRVGPVVLLGEVDIVRNLGAAGALDELAVYGEADWMVRRGVNLKITHGRHDPDMDAANAVPTRTRVGAEVFPIPFLRLAAFYAALGDPRSPGGPSDLDRVSVEAHIHF